MLKKPITKLLLLSVSVPLLPAQAMASLDEALNLPSVVKVEMGSDASRSDEQFIDLDHGLSSGGRVMAGAGRTSYDGRFTATRSSSWLAGLSSHPLNEFVFSLVYEKWRRKESNVFNTNILRLERDTVIGSLRWQSLDWSVTLAPRQRNINIRPANTNAVIGIRSPGYAATLSYYGLNSLSVSVGHLVYDYSNNIDLLRDITARSLSIAARIADQFDEKKSTINLDYNFDKASLGLEWQRNVAVANFDTYKAITINGLYEIDNHFSLQAKLGRPVGSTLDKDGFGSLALAYSW